MPGRPRFSHKLLQSKRQLRIEPLVKGSGKVLAGVEMEVEMDMDVEGQIDVIQDSGGEPPFAGGIRGLSA